MLYELAKHPEVQEKVRQQVVSVLGEEDDADPESLQKMPYLRKVIKETSRWLISLVCMPIIYIIKTIIFIDIYKFIILYLFFVGLTLLLQSLVGNQVRTLN